MLISCITKILGETLEYSERAKIKRIKDLIAEHENGIKLLEGKSFK